MADKDPASAAPHFDPATPPTAVRYRVLAWLCSLSFILYIDRLCISKAAPQIELELGISHTAMGFVFGAFTVAYGLFEVPTGRWGDRFGSRGVLTRIVVWWSMFTVLTGCVWPFHFDSGHGIELPGMPTPVPLVFDSFLLLLLIRFLFGAGEAGALPNAARVVACWFPLGGRGPAQGFINTSALVGGAVTPVIAAYVIAWRGWRWAFFLFGLLGVVWALGFHRWFRDTPAEHPGVVSSAAPMSGSSGASSRAVPLSLTCIFSGIRHTWKLDGGWTESRRVGYRGWSWPAARSGRPWAAISAIGWCTAQEKGGSHGGGSAALALPARHWRWWPAFGVINPWPAAALRHWHA